MTTFNFTLSSSTKSNGEKSIIIVLIKERKNTSISILKSCNKEDWSFETSRVKNCNKNSVNINKFIDKYTVIVKEIIDNFELQDEPYDLKDIVDSIKSFKEKKAPISYTEFHTELIQNLKKEGKESTAKTEKDTLKSIQKFFKKDKIAFKEIDYLALLRYASHLTSIGNKNATIGIRTRTIRAVFNKAIKAGLISKNLYPFEKFKIAKIKDNSKKEFLTEEEIQLLKNYECKNNNEQFAKDIFLFSYYARGINFIDLILLTKASISNEHIRYIRRKTGVLVTFKMNDFIRTIIEKYSSDNNSKFIFNILKQNEFKPNYIQNKKNKYLGKYINPYLKNIFENCKIDKHITYYCARHSFATILKFNNVSIEIIREALGHKDIQSTMSYLNTLPENKLDSVIENIIL